MENSRKIDIKKQIKLEYFKGLKKYVEMEIRSLGVTIGEFYEGFCLLPYSKETLEKVLDCKSVLNIYILYSSDKINPKYLSNHKSILGGGISEVVDETFETFHISVAGQNSEEIVEVKEYVKDTFKLSESNEADLDISIRNNLDVWEVEIRSTKRPLNQRKYKRSHMEGGLDPTIAFVINKYLLKKSPVNYLNLFCGSGTFANEVLEMDSTILKNILCVDISAQAIKIAIENLRKYKFPLKFKLEDYKNIDVSDFDTIVGDLPWGYQVENNISQPEFADWLERIPKSCQYAFIITEAQFLELKKLTKVAQFVEIVLPTKNKKDLKIYVIYYT